MALVSVVMPVYQTPLPYLREATESIFQQTFTDFEFIIVDDHSNEETAAFLNDIEDKRARVIRNSENLGITKSLNKGFSVSSGEYIARMDSDDIAVSTRLEKQLRFMESNPDVIVCGSAVKRFTDAGESDILRWGPYDVEEFRARLLFYNCGPVHPSVMFRSSLLKKHHITYDEQYPYSQDYAMWLRCLQYGKISIMEDVLLFYRVHNMQVSKADYPEQRACTVRVRVKQLERLIGPVSNQQIALHEGCNKYILNPHESREWLKYLEKQNRKAGIYDPTVFRKVIRGRQYKQEMVRYTRARQEEHVSFLPAFILYVPFRYKLRKLLSVLRLMINRRRKCAS